MKVLGIDPGTATTGFGVVTQIGNTMKPIDYGVVKTSADLPLSDRLLLLHQKLEILINIHEPEAVAIESLFFNTNTRTALSVGQARGVAVLTAAQSRCIVAEYTPLQVKQAVTGYGRADKRQIQQMVKSLLCLEKIPRPDDAADALAIAICYLSSYKLSNTYNTVLKGA